MSRQALIRLAAVLPTGSSERRTILASLGKNSSSLKSPDHGLDDRVYESFIEAMRENNIQEAAKIWVASGSDYHDFVYLFEDYRHVLLRDIGLPDVKFKPVSQLIMKLALEAKEARINSSRFRNVLRAFGTLPRIGIVDESDVSAMEYQVKGRKIRVELMDETDELNDAKCKQSGTSIKEVLACLKSLGARERELGMSSMPRSSDDFL